MKTGGLTIQWLTKTEQENHKVHFTSKLPGPSCPPLTEAVKLSCSKWN